MSKKVFCILEKSFVLVSTIVFALSFFLPAFITASTSSSVDYSFHFVLTGIGATSYFILIIPIIAIVGLFLIIWYKKLKMVGYALVLGSIMSIFALLLATFLNYTYSGLVIGIGVGFIFVIVSFVLFLIACLFAWVAYLLNGEYQNTLDLDSKIEKVKSYKELEKDGIITKEEYEAKKIEILGLKKEKTTK